MGAALFSDLTLSAENGILLYLDSLEHCSDYLIFPLTSKIDWLAR